MPARLSAAAMPMPPNPAPTTTTRYDENSATGPSLAVCAAKGREAARAIGP